MQSDIEAVVTSFNQGSMILEAVESLCVQTLLPRKILVIDDGSTDPFSLSILKDLGTCSHSSVPVEIHHQENRGVSAARNAGIRMVQTPMALILDGDDKLEPTYIEEVSKLLRQNSSMVAASSYMRTFGVMDSVVCPSGGRIQSFLPRNCCPATHILRLSAFAACKGYDESMRSGFEDWDFFLSILETDPEASVGIVKKPLMLYRTAPASSNLRSMEKRLTLMEFLIKKHIDSYHGHLTEALLGMEAISNARLYAWEAEMLHAEQSGRELCNTSKAFLESPSYGDGGMAAAVRITSAARSIT